MARAVPRPDSCARASAASQRRQNDPRLIRRVLRSRERLRGSGHAGQGAAGDGRVLRRRLPQPGQRQEVGSGDQVHSMLVQRHRIGGLRRRNQRLQSWSVPRPAIHAAVILSDAIAVRSMPAAHADEKPRQPARRWRVPK